MKKGNKLAISLIAFFGALVGTTTTSTLAWFQTMNVVKLDLDNLVVYNDDGNLAMVAYPVENHGTDGMNIPLVRDPYSKVEVTYDDKNIADCSGDGRKFYRPEFDPMYSAKTHASKIHEVHNAKSIAGLESEDIYYVQIGLRLYNQGTADMGIYLGHQSYVAPVSSNNPTQYKKNQDCVDHFRVAVWDGDLGQDEVMNFTAATTPNMVWQPNANADSSYLREAEDEDHDGDLYDDYLASFDDTDYFKKGALERVPTDAEDLPGDPYKVQRCATIPGLGYKDVVISFWFDGAMQDIQNASIEGVAHINLAFNAIYRRG